MVAQMETEDVSNEVRKYSIVVGLLLIVIFVVPCVMFALFSKYCQKQTRNKRKNSTVATLITLQHRSSITRFFPSVDTMLYNSTESSEFCSNGPLGLVECSLEKLQCTEKIGSMGSSLSCLESWKGRVPSKITDSKAVGKLISVKKICASDPKNHQLCLKAQLNTLTRVPPHLLLVNLLGVCTNGGIPQAILLEYPPHGSLHSFLVLKRRAVISGSNKPWLVWTNRDTQPDILEMAKTDPATISSMLADPETRCHPYSQTLDTPFTETDLLLFAVQIAAAMQHLTSNNILHKTLSSENLLISSNFYLKLSAIQTNASHSAVGVRTLKRTPSGRNLYKWDAPEAMEMDQHTEKTEVWRFGMTLWEISSLGDIPFAEIPNRSLSDILKSGDRPRAPDGCSPELYKVMTDCWDLSPDSRPTFTKILQQIQYLMHSDPDNMSCSVLLSPVSVTSESPLCQSSSLPEPSLLHHRPRNKRPLIYTQHVQKHSDKYLEFISNNVLLELDSEDTPDATYLETAV